MAQGIGVRYSEQGVRLLSVVRSDKSLKITGLAVGPPEETLDSFMNSDIVASGNVSVTIGLAPGNFVSSSMMKEEGMTSQDMKKHLKWEIEKKILSGLSDYILDYFITDGIGCVFAGRRELIEKEKSLFSGVRPSIANIYTDVETVALYNGSEGAGEVGNDTMMVVSVEAEGISSLVIDRGALVGMDSFPVQEQELAKILPCLDSGGMNAMTQTVAIRLSGYIEQSLQRLTSYGDFKDKPTLNQLVLSGGGAYCGNLAGVISQKTGIPVTVSNPLKERLTEVPESQEELVQMSAAFTSCYGLALRALED
ncbi:pilus assembly protein PilM [bacterium]|nr:pilus assembly protein PilM [bacterium]